MLEADLLSTVPCVLSHIGEISWKIHGTTSHQAAHCWLTEAGLLSGHTSLRRRCSLSCHSRATYVMEDMGVLPLRAQVVSGAHDCQKKHCTGARATFTNEGSVRVLYTVRSRQRAVERTWRAETETTSNTE